jgi:hypothetical protein
VDGVTIFSFIEELGQSRLRFGASFPRLWEHDYPCAAKACAKAMPPTIAPQKQVI